MRLETMVVGGVADRAVLPRQRRQPLNLAIVFRPQRLFDQNVLAPAEEIIQHGNLRLVGYADQCRVVTVKRCIFDAPIFRFAVDGVNRGDKIATRDAATLLPLHTKAGNDHAH